MNDKYERDSYKNGVCIKLVKNKCDTHSQDVILLKDTPIISHRNCKQIDIVNNETFIIIELSNKEGTIKIKNEFNKELTVSKDEFQNLFYVAYCITIHSSQGSTYNEPYTIHDWERLNKKLKYVSLTRSTNINNINII